MWKCFEGAGVLEDRPLLCSGRTRKLHTFVTSADPKSSGNEGLSTADCSALKVAS